MSETEIKDTAKDATSQESKESTKPKPKTKKFVAAYNLSWGDVHLSVGDEVTGELLDYLLQCESDYIEEESS